MHYIVCLILNQMGAMVCYDTMICLSCLVLAKLDESSTIVDIFQVGTHFIKRLAHLALKSQLHLNASYR